MEGFTTLLHQSNRYPNNRRSSRDTMNELAYSVVGIKNKKHLPYVIFYIGLNIAKKARLMVGDMADIAISDCKNLGLISRTNNGGRKISPGSGKKGTVTRYRVQFKPPNLEYPFNINELTVLQNVSVEDEGILFEWPREG